MTGFSFNLPLARMGFHISLFPVNRRDLALEIVDVISTGKSNELHCSKHSISSSSTLPSDSHQITAQSNMMTSSNGNIFRVTGPLYGEFTGHRWTPRTKASDAELWCFFFYLGPSKRWVKQSWGWWFETPSRSLWRHCNDYGCFV